MNRECAVLASSGKKKSGLDRDITADVPFDSFFFPAPREAGAFPPSGFAFFAFVFFIPDVEGFFLSGSCFLLFFFVIASVFFEDDAKEKKVVSYCLASLLFHYSLNQGPNVVRGSIRKRVSRLAIAHSIFVHLHRSLLSTW